MNTLTIAITGPESSGKSQLAKELAGHYKAPFVAEKAREYLNGLNRPYKQNDVFEIADLQLKAILEAKKQEPEILFLDTDLTVIFIWLKFKYQYFPRGIHELMLKNAADHYLLMDADLPWEPDPLRENPDERKELLILYHDLLLDNKLAFDLISGKGGMRTEKAIKICDRLIFEKQKK